MARSSAVRAERLCAHPDGCPSPARAGRGSLCGMHSSRLSRHGELGPVGPLKVNPPIVDGCRECLRCHVTQPMSEFYEDDRLTDGYVFRCKACCVAQSREWYQANPDRVKAQARDRAQRNRDNRRCACGNEATNPKGRPRCLVCIQASKRKSGIRLACKRHGITSEEWHQAWALQEGRCAVNPKHPLPTDRLPDIEHCHITGVFRGLTCNQCNQMLGHGGDDPETLELGAAYLRKPRQLRLLVS